MASATVSSAVAPEKYAQMAWVIGLGHAGDEAARRTLLFERVEALLAEVGIPRSLAAYGIAREDFEAALPDLTRAAFDDPSLRTNPRIPLIGELTALLRAGYEG